LFKQSIANYQTVFFTELYQSFSSFVSSSNAINSILLQITNMTVRP